MMWLVSGIALAILGVHLLLWEVVKARDAAARGKARY